MASRKKNGLFASPAVTEAARRQLMAQVPSWELKWVTPEILGPGSPLKVYRWVRTDKIQQFSDDEGEADDPLAPLPDEPDPVEGDDEEGDDDNLKVDSQIQSREISEAPSRIHPMSSTGPSRVRSPKTHPLATSLVPESNFVEDSEHIISAPQIALDPLGPSEAPHLEPLNEDDLEALGMGLANADPSPYDIPNDLNVVDTDTVMKDINDDSLGA